MKQRLYRLIPLLLLLFSLSSNTVEARHLTLKSAPVQVYFSPRGGCTEAVVQEMRKAKLEILVQAYSFTSKDIARALVDAKKRGVHTEIILDKSNRTAKYSAADFTAHMGIPTYIDSAHAIAHNKIMIIDRKVVVTGSFNFTIAAEEKNAENLLIIRSRELAAEYIKNWNKHRAHGAVYRGRWHRTDWKPTRIDKATGRADMETTGNRREATTFSSASQTLQVSHFVIPAIPPPQRTAET